MTEFKENLDSIVKRVSQESVEIIHISNLFLFTNVPSEKRHYYQKLCGSFAKLDLYQEELVKFYEEERNVSNQLVESE